jgi:hypothetical protein
MGTPVAPTYANIVLYMIERPLLLPTCLFYRRYIDDVFAIFVTDDHAWIFFHAFNGTVPSIQFEEASARAEQEGVFLDLKLTLRQGRIHSTLYQKAANLYSYIPPSSDHRATVFSNFILEEHKRYRLSCTDPEDYYHFASLFEQRLLRRGYTHKMIALARSRVPTRATLLTGITPKLHPRNPNRTSQRPVVVLSLPRLLPSPRWGQQLAITPRLKSVPEFHIAYYQGEILVAHRNAANTAHLLLSSLYSPPNPSPPR